MPHLADSGRIDHSLGETGQGRVYPAYIVSEDFKEGCLQLLHIARDSFLTG